MNKKGLIALTVILMLTASAVLVPVIMNIAGNASRIDAKELWEYDGSDSRITASQVAKMFYNNEFASESATQLKYSDERLCNVACDVLKTAISNQKLCHRYQSIAQAKPNYYSVGSILTLIDDRPVALNFIVAEFSLGDEHLQIYFEEKTKALLYFEHWIYRGTENEQEEVQLNDQILFSQLEELAVEYYEKTLGLTKEKYAFGRNEYLNGVSFGVLQYSKEPVIEFG